MDNGLRVAPIEQPHTAVSTGSTVMAVGATEDPAGDIPPHPVFWLEVDGSFEAMDDGPALGGGGRMLAALPVGRDRVLVVGEDGDLQDADAAVWTYAVGEGTGNAESAGD